jgi:hypothetical protein
VSGVPLSCCTWDRRPNHCCRICNNNTDKLYQASGQSTPFPRAKPAAAAAAAAAKQRVSIVSGAIENRSKIARFTWIIMLRLFQKLLTDKELTPPDDWDPPIGYSRNTWGNIVHNKVRLSSIKFCMCIDWCIIQFIMRTSSNFLLETNSVLRESVFVLVQSRKVHIVIHRSAAHVAPITRNHCSRLQPFM